jgi:hypothetical protein
LKTEYARAIGFTHFVIPLVILIKLKRACQTRYFILWIVLRALGRKRHDIDIVTSLKDRRKLDRLQANEKYIVNVSAFVQG